MINTIMRHLLKVAVVVRKIGILLLLGSVTAAAQASGSEQLQQFLTNVSTLNASFTQEVISESGQAAKQSSGTFLLSKPGKFRWAYSLPYVQEIITDGETLWIYDPDLDQVTIKSFSESLSASPVALLTQHQSLQTNFNVEDINYDVDGLDWVSLKPKTEDSDFQQVYIGLMNNTIIAMDLFDLFGQKTRIRFNDVEINAPIDEQIYQFIPPDGVDVIGGTS